MPLQNRHWLFIIAGIVSLMMIAVLGLFGTLVYFSSTSADGGSPQGGVFKTGQLVKVGYLSYTVYDARYTTKLSDNQFLEESPDANFLLVEIGVQNLDREERMLPPIKLIDEAGAEYGTSDKSWMVDDNLGLLENLNPGVTNAAIYSLTYIPIILTN